MNYDFIPSVLKSYQRRPVELYTLSSLLHRLFSSFLNLLSFHSTFIHFLHPQYGRGLFLASGDGSF